MPGLQSALLTMAAALIVTSIPAMGLPSPRPPREQIAAPELLNRNNSAGKRMALLIGVSDYPGTDSDLDGGPLNDVTIMKGILQDQLGFSKDEILVLTDAAATRNNILAAVKNSLATIPADGVVVVYFSGHGSQIEDDDGDEADGLDEVIIVRGQNPDKIAIIRDEELSALASYISASRTLFLLDNCYSGTGTRGSSRPPLLTDVLGTGVAEAGLVQAAVPGRPSPQPKKMAALLVASAKVETRSRLERAPNASPEPTSHLLLAASAETETAVNMPLKLANGNVASVGLFTAALYRALRTTGYLNLTFGALNVQLQKTAKATTSAMQVGLQTPQVEGSMSGMTLSAFFGLK